jgi:hypothetical protein
MSGARRTWIREPDAKRALELPWTPPEPQDVPQEEGSARRRPSGPNDEELFFRFLSNMFVMIVKSNGFVLSSLRAQFHQKLQNSIGKRYQVKCLLGLLALSLIWLES